MTTTLYRASAHNQPGGAGRVHTLAAEIAFDGSASMGDAVPGPAHLLAASLAACVLKNVERFGQRLPFAYSGARIEVELERQDSPPRITRASYRLHVDTDEPLQRCALLHKNIRKFGTITNTLAQACAVEGALLAVRTDGSVEPAET